MQVMIAGGGIGGLVTALSLHDAGIDVRVFESVPEIRALGVGINVLPHAVKELTELGLLDELDAVAVRTRELAYFNKFGQQIWSEPRGMEAGYNWPQFSIHRGELQIVLLKAVKTRLGADAVITNAHLEHFEETPGGRVTAHFTDRATGASAGSHTADALIGADGIHSTVRRTFYPDEGDPVFSGQLLWRGVTTARPFMTGATMIMAGHQDQKFVCYPISDRLVDPGWMELNWIAEIRIGKDKAPPKSDWNRPGDKADFLPQFRGWKFDWLDVPGVIDAADAIYEFPMIDRDPVPRWSHGPVTLLGDAAHPMYPNGSNGASQAIVDARALTRALAACSGDAVSALAAYEAERLNATAEIVRSNRKQGPEEVMQLAEDRAPDGFDDILDVIPADELEKVATRYKRVAGFDKDRLNAAAS